MYNKGRVLHIVQELALQRIRFLIMTGSLATDKEIEVTGVSAVLCIVIILQIMFVMLSGTAFR
jgi:hypothetical protein